MPFLNLAQKYYTDQLQLWPETWKSGGFGFPRWQVSVPAEHERAEVTQEQGCGVTVGTCGWHMGEPAVFLRRVWVWALMQTHRHVLCVQEHVEYVCTHISGSISIHLSSHLCVCDIRV